MGLRKGDYFVILNVGKIGQIVRVFRKPISLDYLGQFNRLTRSYKYEVKMPDKSGTSYLQDGPWIKKISKKEAMARSI